MNNFFQQTTISVIMSYSIKVAPVSWLSFIFTLFPRGRKPTKLLIEATASMTTIAMLTLISVVSTISKRSSRDSGSPTPCGGRRSFAVHRPVGTTHISNVFGLERRMTYSIAPLHCRFVQHLLQNGQNILSRLVFKDLPAEYYNQTSLEPLLSKLTF